MPSGRPLRCTLSVFRVALGIFRELEASSDLLTEPLKHDTPPVNF
jgi:hypothetical protein